MEYQPSGSPSEESLRKGLKTAAVGGRTPTSFRGQKERGGKKDPMDGETDLVPKQGKIQR